MFTRLRSYLGLFILAFLTGIGLMSASTLAAHNGPNPASTSSAYILIGNRDDGFKYLYSFSGSEKIEQINGASYDEKTNTLKLKNFNQPDYRIEANEMGDDFKIEVSGDNHVQLIVVWGYGYGGSLTLTGDGSISINENKKTEFDVIRLMAEGAASSLVIDQTVTVNAYLPDEHSLFGVYETTASSNGLELKNETANKTYKVDAFENQQMKIIYGYDSSVKRDYVKVVNTKDKKNQYGAILYNQNTSGDLYEIYRMVEVPSIGIVPLKDKTLSGPTLNPDLMIETDGVDEETIALNHDMYYINAIDTSSSKYKPFNVYKKGDVQYGCIMTSSYSDANNVQILYSMYEFKNLVDYGIGMIIATPINGEINTENVPDGYEAVKGDMYYTYSITGTTINVKGTPVQTKKKETSKKKTKPTPKPVGSKFTDKVSKAKYKVVGSKTVEYLNPTSKKVTSVTVPTTVKDKNGIKYKVVSVGRYAFKKYKKIKSITIKTTTLDSKKVSKKAFSGLKKKVRVTIPKSKRKTYKKLLAASGLNKKIKIRVK